MVWTEGGEARMRVPTLVDVLEARRRIAPYLLPTPLHSYPVLDRLLGAEVWVKHENHQPIGAFKVRGGINLVSRLDDGERERGVITASTGNHGQSIAYASRLFGVRAIVCVPEGANPVKVESIRALGAEIVVAGGDFDEAREHCERLAAAEGLATRTAFELPQRILWERLDDFVLVEEHELRDATYRMIELTRNLVEPAGAAALAGALRLRSRLSGKRVALVASGGNISPAQLREVLAAGPPAPG